MRKFSNVSGKVVALPWKNIDTDMIIPAQYLTSVESEGFGDFLFKRFREQDPEFILNRITGDTHSILLGGANFGCGSSREHAVWALRDFGIRAVIAPSFSDIFTSNAFKNGLLLIKLSSQMCEVIRHSERETLTINLEDQIIQTGEKTIPFEVNPFRKNCLLNGLDDLGYLCEKSEFISDYRSNHPLYIKAEPSIPAGVGNEL